MQNLPTEKFRVRIDDRFTDYLGLSGIPKPVRPADELGEKMLMIL